MNDIPLIMSEGSIYLVRHAQSIFNIATQEEKKNNPEYLRDAILSEEGKKQLKDVVIPLEVFRCRKILCSPLRRSLDTAVAISEVIGAPIEAHACLAEVRRDIGDVSLLFPSGRLLFPSLQFRSSEETFSQKYPNVKFCPGTEWSGQLTNQKASTQSETASTCECAKFHECEQCIANRICAIANLMKCHRGIASILIVSHCDLMERMCGWKDAPNLVFARVRLAK